MTRTQEFDGDLPRMREWVAEHCRNIASSGVAVGGAGNVSVRIGSRVLITRRGLRFESATPSDICVLGLDGTWHEGGTPSSESQLHLAIYARTDVRAVVHTHGRHSVAVGLVHDELPAIHYNILRLGIRVPTVPYFVFGSEELAHATADAVAEGARAVLLRNHGAVACAAGLEEAIEFAQVTEWICGVYLSARSIGEPALLSRAQIQEVAEQAARYAYGRRESGSDLAAD